MSKPVLVACLLAATAAAALLASSCRSLPKSELQQRVAALEKNAALTGLERLEFSADLGGGDQPLELVYHHAPGPEGNASPPIVLVHGTPSTLYAWTELIHGTEAFEGLAAARDVYAIEVIGHGFAPGDASPYSFDRCARFVAGALAALDLERVHLVGSSYGGEFAWRAALLAQERIASVALLDASGIERREGDWLSEEIVMRENGLADLGWLLNSRDRIASALAPHFDGIPADRVEEFFLVCENAHNWKAMIALARDENGQAASQLPNLRAPVLLLWGANDLAYPPDHYAQRFADLLPDSELVTLPDTGHYPHEQRPELVVPLLEGFYDEVEARP